MDHDVIDDSCPSGVSHAPCSPFVALEEAERGISLYDFPRVETQAGISLVDVIDADLDLLVGDADLVRRAGVGPVPISQDRVVSPGQDKEVVLAPTEWCPRVATLVE
jgi:hypothetical protein